MAAASYMKSLRSVSSPLSSDSELLDDELRVGFLAGVDRPTSRAVLFEFWAGVLRRGEELVAALRGEEWLTVALGNFFATTCMQWSINFLRTCRVCDCIR